MRFYRFKTITVDSLWGYEKWLLSSLQGRESVLLSDASESEGGNTTLNDLILKEKEKLLGKRVWKKYGENFPLLVKFIHTHDKLSVQVHPSDAQADRMNRERDERGKSLKKGDAIPYAGKTEMWYVTDAQPNASLLLGFNRKISKTEFELGVGESLRKGEQVDVEEFLAKFYPKA